MSATTTTTVATRTPAVLPPRVRRTKRRSWRSFVLPTFTNAVIVYLLIPIAVMIAYTFNRMPAASTAAAPKVSFHWNGFTFAWWRQWNGVPDLTGALWNSLLIAVTSTVVATVLGTLIALAFVRYRFRGRTTTDLVMFLNIAAPEIVLGASLLSFLVMIKVIPLGLDSIFIAHVMFNIAFVAITVRARLAGYDNRIEEAAMDLYAGPVETFVRITLPMIWPGILAGALLAFALSIDDFVITNFVAGQTLTFPLWVYGAVKAGIPPQVFVMGTFIFAVGAAVAGVNLLRSFRAEPIAAATADSEDDDSHG
jgi:spermidine/putrescine transport system permease protein